MNIKPVLLSVGDLSLSQLFICQVANTYFKSSDYKKNKQGLTIEILKAKESYFSTFGNEKLAFIFNKLKQIEVFTDQGHPLPKFDLIMNKSGIKSVKTSFVNMDLPVTERQAKFREEVYKHQEYPQRMLEEFYNWWAPIDQRTQTMRFEDKEYFQLPMRLATWASKGGYKKNALDFTMGN